LRFEAINLKPIRKYSIPRLVVLQWREVGDEPRIVQTDQRRDRTGVCAEHESDRSAPVRSNDHGLRAAAQRLQLPAFLELAVDLLTGEPSSGIPGTTVDFTDIDYIAVIAQTGSAIGSNDYAIDSIKAVGP
jgi:hypothetical protein